MLDNQLDAVLQILPLFWHRKSELHNGLCYYFYHSTTTNTMMVTVSFVFS